MADIFISYTKTDRALAKALTHSLEEAGFSVWWDQRIEPTTQWDAAIERELKQAGAVIALWTPAATQSEWVRSEADFAKARRKLLSIMVKECELPVAFRLDQAIHLTHLAIAQGNLLLHPDFAALVQATRKIMKESGVFQTDSAEDALRKKRKKARQQAFGWAITILVLGGGAAGAGYFWWNEQQNTRKAEVTALGAGMGLGQLAAHRISTRPPGEATPFYFEYPKDEPPCVRAESGGAPCAIAWIKHTPAGTGIIPDMAPQLGPGGSYTMNTTMTAIAGTTDHQVFAGGIKVDYDFAAHCDESGATCGITATSGQRRPSTDFGSRGIDVGLADGAVVRVSSTGEANLQIEPPSPPSPIVALDEAGGPEIALRANGQLLVGTATQQEVAQGFFATVVAREEINLVQWIEQDGGPTACTTYGPRAYGAQGTEDGLGIAVITCDGQLLHFSRADTSTTFQLDGRTPAVAGRVSLGATSAGSFMLFGPNKGEAGVTLFDPATRTVRDFPDGIDADVGNIRGRLAIVVLQRDGNVVLQETGADTPLATIPLLAQRETAAPAAADGVELDPSGITINFTTSTTSSNWQLVDPAGPLILSK